MQEVFMTAFVDELNKLAQQVSTVPMPTMTKNKLFKQNTEFGKGQWEKSMKQQSMVPNIANIAKTPK